MSNTIQHWSLVWCLSHPCYCHNAEGFVNSSVSLWIFLTTFQMMECMLFSMLMVMSTALSKEWCKCQMSSLGLTTFLFSPKTKALTMFFYWYRGNKSPQALEKHWYFSGHAGLKLFQIFSTPTNNGTYKSHGSWTSKLLQLHRWLESARRWGKCPRCDVLQSCLDKLPLALPDVPR